MLNIYKCSCFWSKCSCFWSLWGLSNFDPPEIPNAVLHSRNAGIAKKLLNNNMVERYHNEFREFDKVRRGVKETQKYQDGFKVFHNFVRKSARKGLTPADKCGVGINGNAWENMLLNGIKLQKATNLTAEENMIKSH